MVQSLAYGDQIFSHIISKSRINRNQAADLVIVGAGRSKTKKVLVSMFLKSCSSDDNMLLLLWYLRWLWWPPWTGPSRSWFPPPVPSWSFWSACPPCSETKHQKNKKKHKWGPSICFPQRLLSAQQQKKYMSFTTWWQWHQDTSVWREPHARNKQCLCMFGWGCLWITSPPEMLESVKCSRSFRQGGCWGSEWTWLHGGHLQSW